MQYLGQWEERVEALIAELGEIDGVLCVERCSTWSAPAAFGPPDSIAAFLVPYLERRRAADDRGGHAGRTRRLPPAAAGAADLFQIVRRAADDRAGRRSTALAKVADRAARTSKLELAAGRSSGSSAAAGSCRTRRSPGRRPGSPRELVEPERARGRQAAGRRRPTCRPVPSQRTGLPELFLRDELTLDADDVAPAPRRASSTRTRRATRRPTS